MRIQDVTIAMRVQADNGEGGASTGTVLDVDPAAEQGCQVLVAWDDSGDKSRCAPEGLESAR